MNTTQIIVTLIGLAVIAWIIRYFWLYEREGIMAQTGAGGVQEIDVTVKGGYQPATILAHSGQRLRLNFTRREASLCGEEVVFPSFGKRAHLPENLSVSIEVTPEKPGVYEFTCGMNMYRGKVVVEGD
jgi:plastocyanin domain-containing protein